jgi:pyrimidine-specific ribonucleoside hydrolase
LEVLGVIDVVWDMETNDPDDFLTLLLLAGHPQVNLKAVTVLPGSADQVGLIQHALREWFHLDIPIGARNLDYQKSAVSPWHYAAYGQIPPSRDAQPAAEVLAEVCDAHTTLITGAALTNLRAAISLPTAPGGKRFTIERLVVQGGFAGEGVVPAQLQLEKFRGLTTCPTHNLMGDPKATLAVLEYPGFPKRSFVAKNVCHRVSYDRPMHEQWTLIKDCSPSLALIWQGMDVYLRDHPGGKMLHDPLAACCAIDNQVATWAEVEIYREGNAWGSRLSPGSHTWISVDYDHEKFMQVFTAH